MKPAARNCVFPNQLACQSVQFHEIALSGIAMTVNLTACVHVWNAVFNVYKWSGIGVVVVVVMPNWFQIVEIDT